MVFGIETQRRTNENNQQEHYNFFKQNARVGKTKVSPLFFRSSAMSWKENYTIFWKGNSEKGNSMKRITRENKYSQTNSTNAQNFWFNEHILRSKVDDPKVKTLSRFTWTNMLHNSTSANVVLNLFTPTTKYTTTIVINTIKFKHTTIINSQKNSLFMNQS